MSTEQPENDPHAGSSGPAQTPLSKEQPTGGRPSGDRQPEDQPPPGEPPSGSGSPYDAPGSGTAGPYGSSYGDPYGSAGGTGPAAGAYGPGESPLAGMPPLASRGRRLLARIIDALIIGIPVAVVASAATGFDFDNDGGAYWQGGLYTLAYFVYEGLMLSNSGQTLGKRWMRVRVAILQDGAVPTGSPAWTRSAVYHLPTLVPCIGSLFWLVNVLFCTWDQPYRQCLHDKSARTVVVAVT